MASPKSKPTALKVLEGNPGRRPLNKNEPKPPLIAPECPEELSDKAKEEWARTAPILERLGLLTELDMATLAGYCENYARWLEAVKFLKKNGTTYQYIKKRDKKGKPKDIYIAPFPQVAIARQCMEQITKLCAEFGMTPSSRCRMLLPSENPDDPFEKLLSKKGI
ncbi:hypothetical protein ES708_28327 [subsurface metagenome]